VGEAAEIVGGKPLLLGDLIFLETGKKLFSLGVG
jgi:hypothetical protein